MPDPAAADLYLSTWSPADYLRQYYMTPSLATDEQNSLRILANWLRRGPRIQRAIEVGCGPVPYRAVLLTPYAEEIHLADYLPSNLEEVQRWQDEKPDGHDWDGFLGEALRIEGSPGTVADVRIRKAELRRKLTGLLPCDLTQPHPLDHAETYDLVTSFYCAEAISTTIDAWQRHVANLTGLIAPGGRLFIVAMRNAQSYRVFDSTFPATPVNETDWNRLLPTLGFDPARTEIDVVAVPDFADEGFDSVCIVRSQKSP